MFLRHLVKQSHNVAKSDAKPRRNIQYRDVANAVARVENLEFLTDVVPKTTTYRKVKQKQPNKEIQMNGLANGQATLDAQLGVVPGVDAQATNGAGPEIAEDVMDVDDRSAVSMHTVPSQSEPATMHDPVRMEES